MWVHHAVATTVFLIALATQVGADSTIIGRASVIDGDTIDIGGVRIRFSSIDAPESWQTCANTAGKPYSCGKAAADALDTFLARSRPTRCQAMGKDRNGRTLANCFRSTAPMYWPGWCVAATPWTGFSTAAGDTLASRLLRRGQGRACGRASS